MKTSTTCFTLPTAIDSIRLIKEQQNGMSDPDFPAARINVNPNPFNSRLIVTGLNMSKRYTFILVDGNGHQVLKRSFGNTDKAEIGGLHIHRGPYNLRVYDDTKKRWLGTLPLLKQ